MSYLQNFKWEVYGPEEGPRLVFLHGLLGSATNWMRIINEFKTKYRVLAYDQRGHGRSFQPEMGYAPEDYALDLKLILDELKWKKIHLVGHSMGGRNALRFAFKWPQYLKSLCIEDIGPEGSPEGMARTQKMIERVPVPFKSRSEAKEYFQGPFLEMMKSNSDRQMLADYLFTNIKTSTDGSADWRFSLQGVIESLHRGHKDTRWEEIEALQVPTLYLRGERSSDLSQEVFDRILQSNSKIEGHVVKDSGHWIHHEQTAEFIRLLKNFLEQHQA